ncbi:hypothetical protein EX30DRAFT_372875 [Ascodesmis nigricans]|uniref:Uncharacterized protein n=1 Tax=Ascodesmis nigricans TaxID=341454 RepID=A0A4S2MSX1_9PEZI|nr:hypothetical protein EX30DRAFT_372875 [Ascodesmis nigricans]
MEAAGPSLLATGRGSWLVCATRLPISAVALSDRSEEQALAARLASLDLDVLHEKDRTRIALSDVSYDLDEGCNPESCVHLGKLIELTEEHQHTLADLEEARNDLVKPNREESELSAIEVEDELSVQIQHRDTLNGDLENERHEATFIADELFQQIQYRDSVMDDL